MWLAQLTGNGVRPTERGRTLGLPRSALKLRHQVPARTGETRAQTGSSVLHAAQPRSPATLRTGGSKGPQASSRTSAGMTFQRIWACSDPRTAAHDGPMTYLLCRRPQRAGTTFPVCRVRQREKRAGSGPKWSDDERMRAMQAAWHFVKVPLSGRGGDSPFRVTPVPPFFLPRLSSCSQL